MSEQLITVTVRGPQEGMYRAGRFWPREATEAAVTPEALERLQAEPRLSVVVTAPEAPKDPPKDPPQDPPPPPAGEGAEVPKVVKAK